eukprot:334586-Hanusia_phi.AAC.1
MPAEKPKFDTTLSKAGATDPSLFSPSGSSPTTRRNVGPQLEEVRGPAAPARPDEAAGDIKPNSEAGKEMRAAWNSWTSQQR